MKTKDQKSRTMKMDEKLEADFETWWWNEGSGMPPLIGEDREIHMKRVAKIAWVGGAIKVLEFEKENDTKENNEH